MSNARFWFVPLKDVAQAELQALATSTSGVA